MLHKIQSLWSAVGQKGPNRDLRSAKGIMLGYIGVLVQKSDGKYTPENPAPEPSQLPESLQAAGFVAWCVFAIPHLP
ncbi:MULTISPECIES: hypothetical protein [unclassified Desulfovibrio]|uniref:hypothetical protein n=1 Tax=unclassified Desulfovibrio TaxID=2593640 RepID=UPI002FDAE6CC